MQGPGTDYYPPPDLPDHRMPPPGQGAPDPRGQEPQEQSLAEPPAPMTPERRMLIIACVLIAAVSVAFILRGVLFTIRKVNVVGTQSVSWQQVAMSAGLSAQSNYFNINEKKIEEGINANRYLIYQGMQKLFPNTLILYVKERVPAASIHYIGISYIMAEDGMILEKTKNLTKYGDLMTISGLDLRDIREGSVPQSTRLAQMDICISLTQELLAQGFSQQVKDINISAPASIYLTTHDGYSIHLGDGQHFRAKIGTARAVIEECRRRSYVPGVIESTVPGEATYRPDSI